MIDRQARDKMAELWKQLLDGSLTIGEFANRVPNSEDPIIRQAQEMFETGYGRLLQKIASIRLQGRLEGLPDHDIGTLRLTGPYALGKQEIRVINRLILFLRTDLPYEPVAPGRPSPQEWWQAILLTPPLVVGLILITLAVAAVRGMTSPLTGFLAFSVVAAVAYRIRGVDYWPFSRRSDYKAALASPTLSTGIQEHKAQW